MGVWLYQDRLSLGPAQEAAHPGRWPHSRAQQAPDGLAAEPLPRQASRRSQRSIFILAPAVTGPASPALGEPRSGTQPGSVFNFGSVVAD